MVNESKEEKKFKNQMTNYELISALQRMDCFSQLLIKAILPMYWIDYKVIYEFYCQEKSKDLGHSQVVTNTAEEYGISEKHVYKIKKRMES